MSARLKVLHVITGLRRGGAEGVLARLIAATRTEFEHSVVALRDAGHFGPLLRNEGISVHALDLDSPFRVLGGTARLFSLIRRERPDVVQTWLYHADLLGGTVAWLADAPAIIWCVRNNNLDARSIGWATRWVARASALASRRIPDAIVYNSTASSREHVAFGYRSANLRIIENGFDLSRFSPDVQVREAARAQLGVGTAELLIGNVARWDPQKDHANLLAALSIVQRSLRDLKLLLVGTGMESSNSDLSSLLRASNLGTRVTLLGPRDDVPAVMNALDIHVLSSLGEAFPNVVAEAMACGTPCVVTDVGDAAHIVGDCGWVVPPRDPTTLAATIERAAAELAERGRESLSALCRARVLEHFALSRMTDAFASLWRELTGTAVRS